MCLQGHASLLRKIAPPGSRTLRSGNPQITTLIVSSYNTASPARYAWYHIIHISSLWSQSSVRNRVVLFLNYSNILVQYSCNLLLIYIVWYDSLMCWAFEIRNFVGGLEVSVQSTGHSQKNIIVSSFSSFTLTAKHIVGGYENYKKHMLLKIIALTYWHRDKIFADFIWLKFLSMFFPWASIIYPHYFR